MEELLYEDEIPVGRAKDLRGQVFGKLTVLYRVKNLGRHTAWMCQCQCGVKKVIAAQNLTQSLTKSCGCYNRELASKNFAKDITNQRFGRLVAIKPTPNRDAQGSIIWECQCDCGNLTQVSTHALTGGNTASCGRCGYRNHIISKKLIGQTFGKLKVIEKTLRQDLNGEFFWKCQCECGNLTEVRTSALTSGGTCSCGCNISRGEDKIAELLRLNQISFNTQYTFDLCRFPDTKAKAKFDFYINKKYLIEFDGIQHFEYKNSGWDTEEKFQKTMQHDRYKNQWCKENNIPLIRIPYTKLDTLCIEDLMLETTQFRVV